MTDDKSRRDVLSALATLPVAANIDLDDEGGERRLPNIDDTDAFWIVIWAACAKGDPHQAVDELLWLIDEAGIVPPGSTSTDAHKIIREAARGEYDDEAVKRRAAYVWGLHQPR